MITARLVISLRCGHFRPLLAGCAQHLIPDSSGRLIQFFYRAEYSPCLGPVPLFGSSSESMFVSQPPCAEMCLQPWSPSPDLPCSSSIFSPTFVEPSAIHELLDVLHRTCTACSVLWVTPGNHWIHVLVSCLAQSIIYYLRIFLALSPTSLKLNHIGDFHNIFIRNK